MSRVRPSPSAPRAAEFRRLVRRGRRAFTLLEILLAVTLAGLVMVALNTYLFSMGELWGRGTDQRLFDKHVRAVSRFVERTVGSAVLPGVATASLAPLVPAEMRLPQGSENVLTFALPAGPHVLPWPEDPLPEVVCAFAVRPGEGLVLYWQSRLEKRYDEEPLRAYIVSPLVTKAEFDYFDSERGSWETEAQLRQGNNTEGPEIPRRMRLTFTYQNRTEETIVSLPDYTREGLPSW